MDKNLPENQTNSSPETKDQFDLLQSFGGSEDLMGHTLALGVSAYPDSNEDVVQNFGVAKQLLDSVRPKDVIEARLHLMMHVAYAKGMDFLNKTSDAQPQHKEGYANLGLKLLRLHNEAVQSLNNYRRGPNQTIRVEHIDKAIIGDIGGGDASRKIRGTL